MNNEQKYLLIKPERSLNKEDADKLIVQAEEMLNFTNQYLNQQT